jgi:hypothetical protein
VSGNTIRGKFPAEKRTLTLEGERREKEEITVMRLLEKKRVLFLVRGGSARSSA